MQAMVKVKNGDTVTDKSLADWAAERWPSLAGVLSQASEKADVVRYGQSAPLSSGKRENVFDRIRAEKREGQKQQEPAQSWMERAGVAR